MVWTDKNSVELSEEGLKHVVIGKTTRKAAGEEGPSMSDLGKQVFDPTKPLKGQPSGKKTEEKKEEPKKEAPKKDSKKPEVLKFKEKDKRKQKEYTSTPGTYTFKGITVDDLAPGANKDLGKLILMDPKMGNEIWRLLLTEGYSNPTVKNYLNNDSAPFARLWKIGVPSFFNGKISGGIPENNPISYDEDVPESTTKANAYDIAEELGLFKTLGIESDEAKASYISNWWERQKAWVKGHVLANMASQFRGGIKDLNTPFNLLSLMSIPDPLSRGKEAPVKPFGIEKFTPLTKEQEMAEKLKKEKEQKQDNKNTAPKSTNPLSEKDFLESQPKEAQAKLRAVLKETKDIITPVSDLIQAQLNDPERQKAIDAARKAEIEFKKKEAVVSAYDAEQALQHGLDPNWRASLIPEAEKNIDLLGKVDETGRGLVVKCGEYDLRIQKVDASKVYSQPALGDYKDDKKLTPEQNAALRNVSEARGKATPEEILFALASAPKTNKILQNVSTAIAQLNARYAPNDIKQTAIYLGRLMVPTTDFAAQTQSKDVQTPSSKTLKKSSLTSKAAGTDEFATLVNQTIEHLKSQNEGLRQLANLHLEFERELDVLMQQIDRVFNQSSPEESVQKQQSAPWLKNMLPGFAEAASKKDDKKDIRR